MGLILLFLLGGLGLLYVGGEALVRGASGLGLRFGLSPLVVGLTVVAFGTSAPELAVSIRAALDGASGIALGNVVGSNVCNVALILGISGLIRPLAVELRLLRIDLPIMLGCSLLLLLLLQNGMLSRFEGALLAAGLVAHLTFSVVVARRAQGPVEEVIREVLPPTRPLPILLALVVAGFGLLILGGNLFVRGAVGAAEALGVSNAVIGLTVVAFGTSLPELAASTVAALKDEGDLALGNVVGSNIFNLLGILGLTSLVEPIPMGDVRWLDLGVMVAAALVLLPLMRTGQRISRLEGAFLVTAYVGYVGWLALSI